MRSGCNCRALALIIWSAVACGPVTDPRPGTADSDETATSDQDSESQWLQAEEYASASPGAPDATPEQDPAEDWLFSATGSGSMCSLPGTRCSDEADLSADPDDQTSLDNIDKCISYFGVKWGIYPRKHRGSPVPACASFGASRRIFADSDGKTRFTCHKPYKINNVVQKRPLLVFLHGTAVGATEAFRGGGAEVADANIFAGTNLDQRMLDTALGADNTVGFHLLAPQARVLCQPDGPIFRVTTRWEMSYRDHRWNVDMNFITAAINDYIANVAPGKVDTKRIFVLGYSNGAAMAALYSVTHNDLVAAGATWSGASPWRYAPPGFSDSANMQDPLSCRGPIISYPLAARRTPLGILYRRCDMATCAANETFYSDLIAAGWTTQNVQKWKLGDPGGTQVTTESCLTTCTSTCSQLAATTNHVAFPEAGVDNVFGFFRTHPMP